MVILYCVIALVVGATLAWVVLSTHYRAELRVAAERSALFEKNLNEAKTDLERSNAETRRLTGELATAKADLENNKQKLSQYQQDLEQMQTRLKIEFENLANRILEEKSTRFTNQNQKNLEQLLSPLKEDIGKFKAKVEEVHQKETTNLAVLLNQIKSLTDLNNQVTKEAKNLTDALKGDSKTQGNWGELILEKVLESSGLTRGTEFTIQTSLKNDEGQNLRPDVVIHLPENRHFVVDSKVSLRAYERYCSSDDPEAQRVALADHLGSVRSHVKELASKRYQDLYKISAPDFVFMFIPVEPAFSRALQADTSLFNDAFEQKIILVTPTTLLATLRTVAQIWKQEKQSRNALEIARKSGALYDKFVGLYEELTEVGSKFDRASEAYREALSKIKGGRGNLIKTVEDIRALGAKASKQLPPDVVQQALEEGSSDPAA